MDYEMELNNIRLKFNYDAEMIKMIKKVFIGMVNHYGRFGYFDRIYNLFMNTRICSFNNVDEANNLCRLYSYQTEEKIENNFDEVTGRLLSKIEGDDIVNTIIFKNVIVNGKIDFDENVSTIIHEAIHALVTDSKITNEFNSKSYRSGFSMTYISDDVINSKLCVEEGFTEYDTKMICIENGYRYNPAYDNHVNYVESFMTVPEIYDMVTRFRVEGFDGIDKKDLEWFKDFKFTILSYDNAYEAKDFFEKKELLNLNKESIKRKIKIRNRF